LALDAMFHDLLAAAALNPVQQEYLLEARQLQAMSLAVHIPLVCFGIAFPALVMFVEFMHLRTGDPLYRTLAKRWSKVMAALFAVGVVTGTILSFELGILWPNFMATFGDVFGLGFTLEGFSFFLEAIFIGIYLYSWDRLSPRMHLLSGIPVVLTGMTGSLTVIAVNAWMNHPGGFHMQGGEAVDVHPWSALFGNSYFWHELVHMYVAGYIVTGFLVAAVYAWGWMKGRNGRYERTALVVALTAACIAAPVQLIVGDWSAREVAKKQPLKLAAFEGLQDTSKGAPFHLGGYYSEKDQKDKGGIEIPKLLSLLAYHNPNATVKGLEIAPKDDRPPVNVVRFSFLTMAGIGSMLAALAVWFLWLRARRKFPESKWFWRGVVAAGPLAIVALICGWITTEVGRQPWVVYGLMRTEDAVTGAGGIPVGYATLVVVYLALIAGTIWILRRLANTPLGEAAAQPPDEPRPAAGSAA
jgi:cytochrome d ubiquinol oxidase subunit I